MEEVYTSTPSGGTASNQLNVVKDDGAFWETKIATTTKGCLAVVKVCVSQFNRDEIAGVKEDGSAFLIRITPLKSHPFENQVILGFVDVPDGTAPIDAVALLEGEVGNEDGPIAGFEKEAEVRIDRGIWFKSDERHPAAEGKWKTRRVGGGW